MASNRLRSVLAFTAAVALMPVAAEATIARAVKFDEKVEQAAAIVLGRVVSQQSSWDAGRQRILTYSKFQIEKTMKGFPSQEITIVTPGGTVDDIAQDFVGVPRFRPGDEHVVFVRNTRVGPTVLFLDQGAYRVEKDSRGDRIVRPLDSNAVLVDTQRGKAVSPEEPRLLRDFEGNVKVSIQRREAMRMEMIEKQRRAESSLWNQIKRNWLLVTVGLLGMALATWQLLKRS